jgi:hypothetical protein
MIVTMLLGEVVIESRVIPTRNLEIDGYLKGLQQDMMEQNEDILNSTKENPTFKIEFPMVEAV